MGEADSPSRHVFISYVREDSHEVDRVQCALESAGVRVWRDTAALWPGEDWRAQIRKAAIGNALVFLACFSRNSLVREKSYQNEELALAIEQVRLRQAGVPWLIPVRFDDCSVPDLELGGGRTLTSLHRVDLFGDGYEQAAALLVRMVLRILGSRYGAFLVADLVGPAAPTPWYASPGPVPWIREPENIPVREASSPALSSVTSGATEPHGAAADEPEAHIICPICLTDLDWPQLPLWRWDGFSEEYVQVEIPEGVNRLQRARLEREAMVRCPGPARVSEPMHFLPVEYGRHGNPVILGAVGYGLAGKTHLLTAMIGEIQRGGLASFGLTSRPMNQALHERAIEMCNAMQREKQVLPGTPEGVIGFFDAFLIRSRHGPERPVVFFDVNAGSLLRAADDTAFLEIADGLIFLVDPSRLSDDDFAAGDWTFDAVLNLLQSCGRLPWTSAAIVLNKADTLPSDHPLARWLTVPVTGLDPDMVSRESAEVLKYLEDTGRPGWTRPYRDCGKATLHVVSATGASPEPEKSMYPQDATPKRVLLPLAALLAMTGVLHGESTKDIGTLR